MRIKIVSDGTRAGTTIVDADTGKSLEGLRVYGIKWEIAPRVEALPVCLLTCRAVNVDLTTEVDSGFSAPEATGILKASAEAQRGRITPSWVKLCLGVASLCFAALLLISW